MGIVHTQALGRSKRRSVRECSPGRDASTDFFRRLSVKVLHVAPSIAQSYGGPTYSLAGYIVASRLAGIDVIVAAPHCAPEDVDAFVSRAGKTELHLFRSVGGGAFAASPTLVRWVKSVAESFDVV